MSEALIMYVGLPGSGKSTLAKDYKEKYDPEAVIVSSDAIREELGCISDMSRNAEIFDILKRRIRENIEKQNVIVDCTNITRKSRADILKAVDGLDCWKIATVFNTPLEQCLTNNSMRERKVPESVIKNMSKRIEIPDFDEGFDVIQTLTWGEWE